MILTKLPVTIRYFSLMFSIKEAALLEVQYDIAVHVTTQAGVSKFLSIIFMLLCLSPPSGLLTAL
jgi:hypothetical protein